MQQIRTQGVATAAAFALALACGGAHADGTATASITGLTFTLVDLDPADGVTPSIEFDLAGRQSAGSSSVYPGVPVLSDNASPATPFGSAATSAFAVPSTGATAGISGDPWAGTYALTATAKEKFGYQGAEGTGIVTIGREYDPGFTLSANTALLVSGHEAADATASDYATGRELSQAGTTIYLYSVNADGGLAQESSTSLYEPAVDTPHVGDAKDFSLVFNNATSTDMTGYFYMNVLAQTSGAVAIPEPAPLALLATGVAGVAWRRRRARSRNRKSEQ